MSYCNKIPNNATSATSSSLPNTIVMRDSDSATRIASIILKGANFVKSLVSPALLTKGFLYFSNNNNHHYALLRNTESSDSPLNLSLEFGQNNANGNFMIKTEQHTNIMVRNNRVGVNTDTPQATLDVGGTVRIGDLCNSGPVFSNLEGGLINIRPFHITQVIAPSALFTNSIIVVEIAGDIELPTNKYDGYSARIINKSLNSIAITSRDPMFADIYLPPTGAHSFVLDVNRCIHLTYIITGDHDASWYF